ncbi:MAG: hypothetical protein FWF29_05800 [Treponema sp.]|nr:hypothetical protein [Treponema sp.]
MKTYIFKTGFVILVLILAVCMGFAACKVVASGGSPDDPNNNNNNNTENELDNTIPIETNWDNLALINGTVVNIDPDTTYQVIKGFGASDCWSGNFVGRWGTEWYPDSTQAHPKMDLTTPGVDAEKVKQQIADYLFSQEFDSKGNPLGIGLSEWRVNFGAGSWEQAWEKGINSRVGTQNTDGTKRDWSNMNVGWERNSESFLADIAKPFNDSTATGSDYTTNGTLASGIHYDWTRQMGQQYWMKEAKMRGLETLIGFSNSPPVPWTVGKTAINATLSSTYASSSGRWTPKATDGGTSAGNLDSGSYDSFAAYLADIADHFAGVSVPDKYRGQPQFLRFNYISPINEPQWDWNEDKQEGSQWANSNIAKVVKALNTAITNGTRPNISADNTKIMMPEGCQWDFLSGGDAGNIRDQIQTFFNPSSVNYVGNLDAMKPWIIAGHTYFTHDNDGVLRTYRQNVRNRALQYAGADNGGVPVQIFSTEWCGLGGGDGADINQYFDDGLFMAKMAFSDIVIAGAQTFDFWTALDMEKGGLARYSFIAYAPGSAVYDINSYKTNAIYKPGAIKTQSTMWAMGNYSLFVRPGFQRISVSGNGLTVKDDASQTLANQAVMVTAYKSPAGFRDFVTNREVNRIVTVFINMTTSTKGYAAKFPDGHALPIAIRCYLTNAANTNGATDLNRQGMRRQGQSDGIFMIPGRSIYTVVYDFPVE